MTSCFGKLVSLVTTGAIALTVGLSSEGAGPRVVAIGDIHGDFDALVGLLQHLVLVDSNRRWTGGNATLVQTGDFVDRGPKTRAVLDLLIDLQSSAPRQGGRVIVLLGNHEALNIYGDLRDVTPADYASFVDNRSERRRKTAYESVAAFRGSTSATSESEWMKSHPDGFLEHREAFGPNGKYGKWLRSIPAVAKVNDTIFLHGGLHPDFASWKIEKINESIAAEIRAYDKYRAYLADQKIALPFETLQETIDAVRAAVKDSVANEKNPDRQSILESFLNIGAWMSIHADGPLWFRGFARWTDEEGTGPVQRLVSEFAVARFVVGHTPQSGEIRSRFGGRVYLIDTGMLSSFFPGGRASALEIQDNKVTPIYR